MKASFSGVLETLLGITASGLVMFAGSDAYGQEKQKYAFKTPPGVSTYTQQHMIDVGDVPGHQLRVYEVHSKYADQKPIFDGIKVTEGWTRAVTDYIDGTGHGHGYTVAVLENGDKIFGRYEVIAQTTIGADGSKMSHYTNVTTLTGGTGKFRGIRGTLRGAGVTDFKTGPSAINTEGEYWLEK
jgi:hypothetical protein